LSDFAFEVPQAGFLRIQIDHGPQAFIGELNLRFCQTVFRDLFGNQVPSGDLEFLFFGVTGELDDLHAISERGLDRIEHVRSGNEHHVGKIERHSQIVVAERMVLFRIEHFEQRR
jgi:hypothetical protein